MAEQSFEFHGPGQFYSIRFRPEYIEWLIRSLKPFGYSIESVNTEKQSELHLTGPNIGLIIATQEKPQTYFVNAYVAEPDPATGKVEVYSKKVNVPTNEDYVQGTISLSNEKANKDEFSRLEKVIRDNCTLVRHMGAEYRHNTLQSSSKENPIPIKQLAML